MSAYLRGLKTETSFLSTEQAAGVYHRESRKGRYQLTYREAKAVCAFEGGTLATYDQLEAARKIGLYHNFKSGSAHMPIQTGMEGLVVHSMLTDGQVP